MPDPQMVTGAALGFAAALAVCLGLLAMLDGRYVSRGEYEATLKGIQLQLTNIQRAADRGRVNLDD